MKTEFRFASRSLPVALVLALFSTSNHQLSTAFAHGTAFTYQGLLNQSGSAYTGTAEFQPTLWDAMSGGSVVASNNPATVPVGVTNGLFVLPLEFRVNDQRVLRLALHPNTYEFGSPSPSLIGGHPGNEVKKGSEMTIDVFGHLFSGRYKSLIMDGSGNGYLKTMSWPWIANRLGMGHWRTVANALRARTRG